MAVVYHLKESEEQKEVLEAKDDEEKASELDGEVEERVTHRSHETMAMTMRRTRHKLEPQCVHKESVKEQQQKTGDHEDTMKTKDLQCMKTHALAATTSTLTLTCSPSGLSHFTHCWVLSCASCRQLNSCRCHHLLNFDLYANSL